MLERGARGRYTLYVLFGIVVLGAFLRFWQLGAAPPGLYRDEAYYALDAVDVLNGAHPIFFEANNGREPLFIYLAALGIAALGRTPVAIRIVAAIIGTLTIPATFLMGRAFFSRRVGLLAAAVCAITVWPINLSRVGLRVGSFPLIAALCFWQGAIAFRTRRARHWVAAGALYGLLFYTYLVARVTALALGAALLVWLVGALWRRPRAKPLDFPWRGLGVAALTALIVAAPLGIYLATHAGDLAGRGEQVSILNPAISHGDPLGLAARQAIATLGMFNVRGDFIPRHNVPLRPVFDPLLGLAFLGGLVVAVMRWRRAPNAFILAWTATMLLPTILAEDAPHFLRAAGILPVVFLFPALGLDAAWTWLAARGWRYAGPALAALVLVVGLGWTWRDYFVIHTHSDAAYFEFETGATALAAELNRFLGVGWDGQAWAAGGGERRDGYRGYIDPRLWDNWPNVRYLTAPGGVRVLRSERALTGDSIILALWPFEDRRATLAQLPSDKLIEARDGAYERGDLETTPRLLYYTVRATPDIPSPNVEADFGVTGLRRAEWTREGDTIRVRLVWDALGPLPSDLSAFVHVLGSQGVVAQADGPPGGPYYPGAIWRDGDHVAEERRITLPADTPPDLAVEVGLYDSQTLARLPTHNGGEAITAPEVSRLSPQ
ncbi:MAG: glycosyltransferase family 39 protein [Anaerolineae bacterium]